MGVTKATSEVGAIRPSTPARRVSIVGGGPTGMIVLERFITRARQCPEQQIDIVVWEPNEAGAGLHDPQQPEYCQLNTVASQINVFAGASSQWPNGVNGPSLHQWLSGRPETAHYEGAAYVPRRHAGAYLSAAFKAICNAAPGNVTITVHREKVAGMARAVRGQQFLLKGANGTQAWTDQLCICLGHLGRKPQTSHAAGRVIEHPYPLQEALTRIQPGEEVGIEGLGLVASDVIAELTYGRGGRYERHGDALRYVPSGKEPIMRLFSRSGKPFRARSFVPPGRRRHQPLVLTREKVDLLRAVQTNGGQLDFVNAILPLLKLEMSVAFHCARVEIEGIEKADSFRERLTAVVQLADPAETRLVTKLDHLNREHGPFDPDFPFMLTLPPEGRSDRYASWLRSFLRNDLREAQLGLLQSPYKAALEVCRDIRDVLRYVVDFEGLTDASHREFYLTYTGLLNQLVGGPAPERNDELIALLDTGIVRLPPGPVAAVAESSDGQKFFLVPADSNSRVAKPTSVDWLVRAHVPSSGVIHSASGLVEDLHRAGLLTSVRSVPGLDGVRVDRLSRPIDAQRGLPVENLAILGPLTEGARFYNHYLAAADGPCRLIDDADLVAQRMLGLPVKIGTDIRSVERVAS